MLNRDETGQFRLDASVDGHDTRFLVDTGADIVALTVADADRLGIRPAPQEFRPIMRSASGTANAAHIQIDRLVVAGVELHDVRGVVVQGLDTNLLGQSALRQLGRVELRGDELRIEPD